MLKRMLKGIVSDVCSAVLFFINSENADFLAYTCFGEGIQLHVSVSAMEPSCELILFVWGWGEEFMEDVEGVEDLWRGKGGRGMERRGAQ